MKFTPAAMAAALTGNIENVIAASTPGGIERQEAAGQAALVASSRLPKDIGRLTFDQIAAGTGIEFGSEADDLFVNAKLSDGWALKPTSHSMWSDLIDANGVARASIFYKAAFYDRSAHITFARRYTINVDYDSKDRDYTILDNKTGAKIHNIGSAGPSDYKAQDTLCNDGAEWLKKNYPNSDDPFAYWNDSAE